MAKGRKGFTLLEVMIAVAIAGGLLVTLLYTLNYHLDIAQRHEAVTVATMLGREKLAGVRDKPGNSEGEFPEPFEGYSFKAELKGSSYPGISEINVMVTDGEEKVVLKEFIRGEALGK
jgi:general secretion pathway protein I